MTLKNKHEKLIILNIVLNFLTPVFEFLNEGRPSRLARPNVELINNINNLKLSNLKGFLPEGKFFIFMGNFLFIWGRF